MLILLRSIALMISSTLIFCIACSSFNFNTENNVEETELKIMTSTPILADWVNQITDNQPAVKSIMPYGVDPHSYTPGAKDIADIAELDLIFTVGPNYEAKSFSKFLENHPEIKEVHLIDYISPIENEDHDDHDEHGKKDDHEDDDHDEHGKKDDHDDDDHDEHGKKDDHDDDDHDEHHDHGTYDPHFWFDPTKVIFAINKITEELSLLNPEDANKYQTRASEYTAELENLDAYIKESLSTIPKDHRNLMTVHESLGYLANRYDLNLVHAVIPNLDSSIGITPQNLVEAIKVIQENDIHALFLENETPEKTANTVAHETGIKIVTGLNVETLPDSSVTYIDFMKNNIQLIVENLVD